MPNKQRPDQKPTERKPREDSNDESTDLKQREYRGSEGEVHHHTKKYMEEHQGSKKKD